MSSEPFASPSPEFSFDWSPDNGLGPHQRLSTYADAERLCRGPEPVPAWVVTDRAGVDTELGVLKTGKEADCFLIERAVPGGRSCLLAAKRYRGEEHRLFHRSAAYTEGRTTRRSRDARAASKKTAWGRTVAAGQWAYAEWDALKQLWLAGLAVPYPVQIEGTELLMEFVSVSTDDGGRTAAPRLAQCRPDPALLASYFDQMVTAMTVLAAQCLAHGDLSPYNVLAAGERLVVIDLPQVVDLIANPAGMDFLLRDCHNICAWFRRRGLDVDEHELFGELVCHVY